ncbi:MAG: ATP-binding cassette domain-containing protein [Actinomycetota bacterium]|nr:ATP-binding cassette domain-containing protein [Actinomycetota bacterium]
MTDATETAAVLTSAGRSPAAPVVIRTVGLTKVYAGTDFAAVDHLDLEVSSGEVFGLLGPNGAGKTTTAGMLTTRVLPTSGTAHIAGIDVVDHPALTKQIIGVVSQQNTLDRALTVWENLYFHGRLFGISARDSRAEADPPPRAVPAGQVGQGVGVRPLGAWPNVRWWPGRCSTARRCCSSTSRPRDWTRRAAWPCGRCCASSTPTARPSSSPPTTWRRPTSFATGWPSWTTERSWPSARPPSSKRVSAPTPS